MISFLFVIGAVYLLSKKRVAFKYFFGDRYPLVFNLVLLIGLIMFIVEFLFKKN